MGLIFHLEYPNSRKMRKILQETEILPYRQRNRGIARLLWSNVTWENVDNARIQDIRHVSKIMQP